MIFVNWWLVFLAIVLLAVVASAVVAMRAARRKRTAIKVTVGVFSVPLGLVAILLLSLFALTQLMGCNTHGIPQYSSDGRAAARTETFDSGALGGSTSVTVYAAHGFNTKTVYLGDYRSVKDNDLQWIDDSHLVIHYSHYEGYDEGASCKGNNMVKVTCMRKAE
jgi:hypothetical protein